MAKATAIRKQENLLARVKVQPYLGDQAGARIIRHMCKEADMTRLLGIVIAVTLAAAIVAGCSPSTSDDSATVAGFPPPQSDNSPTAQLFRKATAATATGSTYRDLRDQIVAMGPSALPSLKNQAGSRDWRVAELAKAMAGRIERPDVYSALDKEVKGAVGFAERAHPAPTQTILGWALAPIAEYGRMSGSKLEQEKRREKTLKLWGGEDGTAYMIETMLKGWETPPGGKKPYPRWSDLGRDFCTARLGISTQPVALEALLEVLSLPEYEDIANPAAMAFRGIEKRKAEGPLRELLRTLQRPRRDYVVKALANIKSKYAAPYLAELAANSDSFVIGGQLVEIGGPEAAQALLKMLKDPNDFVKCHAIDRLGQLTPPEAVGPLIETLNSGSEKVRASAAGVLGAFKDRRATDALIGVVQSSPSWWVRSRAADGLGRSGDRRAVPVLIRASSDKSEDVRSAVVTALARMGDPAGADVILAGLNDTSVSVRMSAVRAQKTVQDPRAVDRLFEIFAHGTYQEQLPAKLALRDVTGGWFGTAEQWQEWWSANKDSFRDKQPFQDGKPR